MRNIRILLLVLLFCVLGENTKAERRNLKQARQIATHLFSTSENNITVQDIDDKSDKPFYIFNDKNNNSFVIISGDTRMKTILGISQNTTFDTEHIPCGLSALLSHYSEQYIAIKQDKVFQSIENEEHKIQFTSDIPALISSTWYQFEPYNDDCPNGCPTGCVATAMAQIMNYYKYPDSGIGTYSYTSETNHYRLSYDYGNARFDWASIMNNYDSSSFGNRQSRGAVANLMKACGVSVAMDYTQEGSGALETSIPYALINYFRYNKNVVVYERDYYKQSEWYEKVIKELNELRPVLYCGVDRTSIPSSGHAFIVDGYRESDNMFHVNWGWGGRYDGYYQLDILESPNGRFSSGQSMIAGFCPEETNSEEDIFYAEDFSYKGTIEPDKELNFVITGVYNYSNSSSYYVSGSSFRGVIGIGLFDEAFNFIQSLSLEEVDLGTYYGYEKMDFSFIIPSNILNPNKTYYIVPYAKSNKSKLPTRIRTIGGLTDFYYLNVDGSEGYNPSEEEQPVEKEFLLAEDFESHLIPEKWNQEKVFGAGDWKGKMILIGDDTSKAPNPASGNGYAYLNYNSGTIFSDIRTVTKLITPTLVGKEGCIYNLSFQCRKHSSRVGTTEILTILIDQGCNGQWEILKEQSIPNSNKWSIIQLPFQSTGRYRLAFEGSIEYGSTLFLDRATVALVDLTSIKSITTHNKETDSPTIYDLRGKKHVIKVKGLNLLKGSDGTVKKIFVK